MWITRPDKVTVFVSDTDGPALINEMGCRAATVEEIAAVAPTVQQGQQAAPSSTDDFGPIRTRVAELFNSIETALKELKEIMDSL